MKILILTTSNPYKTAGIVALDLYKSLSLKNGNEVKILVKLWDKYPDKNIIPFETRFLHYYKWVLRKISNLLKRIYLLMSKKKLINNSFQDYDQTITYYSADKLLSKISFKPDVVIVLFMQKYLSYKNLYEINKNTNAPILLYMMDMAPMTGGCHYAWDCKGYQNNCGKCPVLFSNEENDQSRKNWEFKIKYIDKTNATVVAGSEHQFQQLLKSSLFQNKTKYKILVSINSDIFKPSDKNVARTHLKLPLDKKIILLGAGNISNIRKGIKELINALDILYDKNNSSTDIYLAIAGRGTEVLINSLRFPYSLLGRLNHKELAIAFQASDLFLCPSIEDSGPMMINQSIMCGTPVVSFDMGVARDLVITGDTGYRAKLKDTIDLANGILQILELNHRESIIMRNKCRNLGLRLCSIESQANMFLDLLNKN